MSILHQYVILLTNAHGGTIYHNEQTSKDPERMLTWITQTLIPHLERTNNATAQTVTHSTLTIRPGDFPKPNDDHELLLDLRAQQQTLDPEAEIELSTDRNPETYIVPVSHLLMMLSDPQCVSHKTPTGYHIFNSANGVTLTYIL